MTRLPMPALLLLAVGLAGHNPASAQAQAWTVTKVERSDQGFVTTTRINPTSGLTETKHDLVFGKKNEFLKFSISVRPDKKGGFPDGTDFKLVDADGKAAGKQTFFLKGKDNNLITMVYQGDWSSLDGLTLEGPGARKYPLSRKK
jgi:hypothetical protein